MRRSALAPLAVVCLGTVILVAHLAAQGRAPMRQVAYLKASNHGAFYHLGEGGALPGHTGNSVALSRDGNTIAVGASHEDSGARGIDGQPDESAYNAGSVYVFARTGAGWSPQAYVKASNADSGDHFGSSVALSADGNTMAVAAHWESSDATGVNGNQADNSIAQADAVYVFTRSGSTWSQQAYLKASNTGEKGDADILANGDQFGFSLALSADGNTVAVGAISEDGGIAGYQDDNSATSAGAVYVFTRSGNAWSQQAYVKPPTAADAAGGTSSAFRSVSAPTAACLGWASTTKEGLPGGSTAAQTPCGAVPARRTSSHGRASFGPSRRISRFRPPSRVIRGVCRCP